MPIEAGPLEAGAYAGLRVLDLGQGVAAPYCGMLLALHGAEVIKLEPPEGDWGRRLGATYGEHSALSAVYNRGKRSLALDLKSPEGREIVLDLAARADVFIESFRPGVAARLGLGYETLAARNPRLLYVSVSGFGQEGPYAARPCSDAVAQAFSGLIAVNVGDDGAPHRVGAIIVDTLTGLYASQAVAVALFARERRGVGRRLDMSLAQCGAAILGHKLAEHLLEGGAPRLLNAPAGVYRTRDGSILVTLVTDDQFVRLAKAVGCPDLAADPRYRGFAARAENAAPLFAALREAIRADGTDSWVKRLRDADVLCERINGFDAWLADPHVQAIGGALGLRASGMPPTKTPRTPGVPREADAALPPSPGIGDHSRAILAELGVSPAMIDRLAREGVVRFAAAAGSATP